MSVSCPPLIDVLRGQAAIFDSIVEAVDKIVAAAAEAKLRALLESPQRIVLQAQHQIRAAIDGPIIRFSDDGTFDGVIRAENRNQKSRLTPGSIHGMGDIRQVDNRNSKQPEICIPSLGRAVVDENMGSENPPVRLGQPTGGHAAAIHLVRVGTFLDEFLAAHQKGIGCRVDGPRTGTGSQNADRTDHIVEMPCLRIQVHSAAGGVDQFVVRSTLHLQVAIGFYFAGVCVVGRVVGQDHVILIVDLHFSLQFVGIALLLLLPGMDGDRHS